AARTNFLSADFSDLGFFTFADAASLRMCGIKFAAAPRTFRLRTFNGVELDKSQTAPSLRA
ncbi:hypothetical protein E1180_02320, partial [Roseibium denhamense]|uniref:hypothetical protein n=1 Tax=Roseibium denhamense TaxID=76305 RepID=UPI001AD8D073